MPEFIAEPVAHDEAIAFLAGKPAVSRRVFDILLPELKARAFVISGVESATVRQTVRDAIAELGGTSADWDAARAHIVAQLAPWLGARAPYRAELLMRWHGYQAYAAANHRALTELADVFPYQRYITVGDGRVRDSHRKLNNKIFPADHPFWKRHTPPWEPGCRCDKVGVTHDDYERIRRDDARRKLENRWILNEAQLDKARHGTLDLGDGRPIDIRTPSEKGKPPGMEWEAGDFTLPVDALRARYDADIWAEFEGGARRERIDDGRTVWEWLTGERATAAPKKKAARKRARKAAAKVPKEIRSYLRLMANAGLTAEKEWTGDMVRAFNAKLKRRNRGGAKIDEKLGELAGRGLGDVTPDEFRWAMGEVLAMLPPGVSARLPKLAAATVDIGPPGAYGDYDPGAQRIRINAGLLSGHAGELRGRYHRQTMFHELMHWVHMGDPEGGYRDAVKAHFEARTKGERLRAKGRTKYYEDEWYDWYAGAVYRFEGRAPSGLEVPTRYFQLHADPDAMADTFNKLSPAQRAKFLETHAEAMRIFFEPPTKA